MRLNAEDDEFYDDEFDYEEEDDYIDDEPIRHSRRSSRRQASVVKEEPTVRAAAPVREPAPAPRSSSKVTPMRSSRKNTSSAVPAMEVCVIKPKTVDDAREITETLLEGRTIILNLEGIDLEVGQRIIDFTSGSCFAISGNLQKISNYIFLVTPANVDISGDFQSIVDAFDVSSIQMNI